MPISDGFGAVYGKMARAHKESESLKTQKKVTPLSKDEKNYRQKEDELYPLYLLRLKLNSYPLQIWLPERFRL
jgi:hypothetical protein